MRPSEDSNTILNNELNRYRQYLETVELASRITDSIKTCNLLFSKLAKIPYLLREDIQAISTLHQQCSGANDFSVKIGGLAELFQTDTEKWQSLFRQPDKDIKRVSSLLRKWLCENGISYDPEQIRIWDEIIELRNASFPYHPTDERIINIVQFFGQSFPINFVELYKSILKKFLESLEMLERTLYNLFMQKNHAREQK